MPDPQPVKDDDYVTKVLGLLAELGGPSPEESVVSDRRAVACASVTGELAARAFDREVDTEWRRTSYSGLIRVQEQPAGVTLRARARPLGPTESDASGRSETERACSRGRLTSTTEPGVPSPMAGLPSGADLRQPGPRRARGEPTPRRPTCAPSWRAHTREQLQWWPVGVAADELADALLPSQLTPLGAPASGLRLVDIPLRDRLCELDFEFPLTGGDRPQAARSDVHLRDLAPLLAAHLPADDPLASYADS